MSAAISALAISCLVVLGSHAVWTQSGASPHDIAPMPDHWVPFSAEMEIVLPTGKRWVGRFVRGADGSTRSETGISLDRIENISIYNYTERMQYHFKRRTGWSSGSVERPPGWPKPLRMSGAMYRRLRKGHEPIEGLDVLVRTGEDSVELIAPQLNGFVIDVRRSGCGPECGTHFRQIELGPQPASLFQPDPPQ